MPSRVHALALLCTVLMLTSCKNQSDTPAPQQQPAATADAPRDTLPVAPPPAGLSGVWTIVAHYIPDIAGMTAAQADAWIGRSIRLGSEIVTEGVRCARPSYTKITLDRDNFLTGAFNLPPGAIMRLANVDAMNVTTVTCEGRALGGLGQLIMEVDADHILSTWDGVFFELERDQDLRALGQEPSWRLDLTKGMNLRLARPGQPDLIMPAPAGKTDPQTGRRTYHAASDRDNLLIVIEPTRCTDPVSGEAFENSVTLTLNGDVLRGCGGPLPVE